MVSFRKDDGNIYQKYWKRDIKSAYSNPYWYLLLIRVDALRYGNDIAQIADFKRNADICLYMDVGIKKK